MKKKWMLVMIAILFITGAVFMSNVFLTLKQERQLEENKKDISLALQDKLEQFNPTLDKFVDQDYKTVISSETNQIGIYKFDRGLTYQQENFGHYVVLFNLEKMTEISKELVITNEDLKDEWEAFATSNQ